MLDQAGRRGAAIHDVGRKSVSLTAASSFASMCDPAEAFQRNNPDIDIHALMRQTA
jgi:hypothetical protein